MFLWAVVVSKGGPRKKKKKKQRGAAGCCIIMCRPGAVPWLRLRLCVHDVGPPTCKTTGRPPQKKHDEAAQATPETGVRALPRGGGGVCRGAGWDGQETDQESALISFEAKDELQKLGTQMSTMTKQTVVSAI